MSGEEDIEKFPEKEAQERFEAALRGALKTEPKPLKEKPKTRVPREKKEKKKV